MTTRPASGGSVTREEALAHAASVVGATDLPVSANLENGFADDPAGVADTLRLALDAVRLALPVAVTTISSAPTPHGSRSRATAPAGTWLP